MAKWNVINNPFSSTSDSFGGKWGNDISRYLNGIDMGSIDIDKEPVIRTNTRYGFGKLKLYDIDESHTIEFQVDNIVSGANRIYKLRSLTTAGTSDYLVTEVEGATLSNKTLTTAVLGSALDASGNDITKINTIGLRDLDASNVSLVNITGISGNSTFGFLSSYGGILSATNITVTYGNASKIHKYEWYSTVPGVNTKLFDITPSKINAYVPIDMNNNPINNAAITLAANAIDDNSIVAHTSTKITIINKTQLNTNIVYNDQANTFGAFNQTIPSGNLRLSNSGFTSTLSVGTLSGNTTLTLPNTTATLIGSTDSRLTDARTPTSHASTHKSAGSDPIKINEFAAPTTNITVTNATTSANGTLPVLSGTATQYLDGSGSWTVPQFTGIGSAGAVKGGVATKSGDGTTKVFTIAHGMATTPAVALVKPSSINAFGEFVTSYDGTNVTLTYQNAPPTGSGNLEYQWVTMNPLATAGGEANTYSTVGTGSAVTKTKTGVDLPFRSFIAGSSKLTLTQNTNDLTFDVNEANFTTSRPPTTHASTHKSGGSDAIKINELAASTTNTIGTNSTTIVNGTLPILSGTATQYLDGTGAWSVPAGTGGGGGSGEANTYSTVGTGAAWTQTKIGVNLPFRSFIVSSKLTLTTNTNDLTLTVNDANLSIAYGQLTSVPTALVRTDQANTFTGTFVQTFPSSTIKVMNPLATFGTTIANSAITANRTLTLPLTTTTLVGTDTTDTLTNKTLTSPIISTITNTGTLTLPTSTDTLMGRATTDTATNKTLVLASNTVTDTSAVAGDVPVHDGTRFLRKAKGADGTFLGVSGGTVGYYTPSTGGGGGLLPDGTTIPNTGRWGAMWGGTSGGRGVMQLGTTGTVNYEAGTSTESVTTVTTSATDDAIAEIRSSDIYARQSNVVFRAKWALKSSTNQAAIMIGLTSLNTLPVGAAHDYPLDSASGILITCSTDIETVYQISRNDGTGSQVKTATAVSVANTTTHTCEINANSTNVIVTIDGGTPITYTTDIPSQTSGMRIYAHIEAIGAVANTLSVYRLQTTTI
jgi:hypothetical protein